MEFLQLIFLGLIQGLTEFLPVSSSAHLILFPSFTGWGDQGLTLDVAAHAGTLLAVIARFRRELNAMFANIFKKAGEGQDEFSANLFRFMILATLPLAVCGFFGRDFIDEYLRSPLVIAFASVFFALLLWWSDARPGRGRELIALRPRHVILIGAAQALALIPGASRAGVTIMAALFLGFNRDAAARFSLLLSIPAITIAGAYEAMKLFSLGDPVRMLECAIVFVIAAIVAWLTIGLFLNFVSRTGMLPYVIYRLMLGAVLFLVFW